MGLSHAKDTQVSGFNLNSNLEIDNHVNSQGQTSTAIDNNATKLNMTKSAGTTGIGFHRKTQQRREQMTSNVDQGIIVLNAKKVRSRTLGRAANSMEKSTFR